MSKHDDKLTVDVVDDSGPVTKKYTTKIDAPVVGHKLTPDPKINTYTDQVEQWVEEETKLYPEAMKQHLNYLKKVRATRKDKYGANTDKTMRWGLSLPPLTHRAIRNHYPEILKDNFYVESIMRRMPGLRTCDKV